MERSISLIVPIYNSELFLRKCINSILSQSFKDFELILINDGSIDKSGEICDHYAELDDRITVIHKKNEGVSVARNIGISNAKGEYITFIDSDDWIEPNMLEEIFMVLKSKKIDLLINGIIFDYVKENNTIIRALDMEKYANTTKDIGEIIISLGESSLFGYAATKVYKTKLIKENNIKFQHDITYMEDLLFTSEMFKVVKSVYISPRSFYHYMIRDEDSLSSKYTKNLYKTIQIVNQNIVQLFEKYEIKSEKYPTNLPDGYVNGIQTCVYNIYHKDCKWDINRKYHFIKKILKDEKLLLELKNYNPKNFYSKLFLLLIKTNNAFLINTIYTLLFKIRFHFKPIYRYIRKKLI